MSFVFGSGSLNKLATCHKVLQLIAQKAIEVSPMDFTIVHGFRDEVQQNAFFDAGASKTPWPDSKHNCSNAAGKPESLAIDFAPWHSSLRPQIRWERTEEFRWLAGFIMGAGESIARSHGYTLRWGGDWDRDGDHRDQTFMDVGHIELVPLR